LWRQKPDSGIADNRKNVSPEMEKGKMKHIKSVLLSLVSIHHNGGKGIALVSGANFGLAAPVTTNRADSRITSL